VIVKLRLSCSTVTTALVLLPVESVVLIVSVMLSAAASERPDAPAPVVVTKLLSIAVNVRAADNVTVVAPSTSVAVPELLPLPPVVNTVHLLSSEAALTAVIVEPAGIPRPAQVVVSAQWPAMPEWFLPASEELRQPVGLPPVEAHASVSFVPGVETNDCASEVKGKVTASVAI